MIDAKHIPETVRLQEHEEPSGMIIFDQLLPEGAITDVLFDVTGGDEVLVRVGEQLVMGKWIKFSEDAK